MQCSCHDVPMRVTSATAPEPLTGHQVLRLGRPRRRATFQISPQLLQRQYDFSSGTRAVVVMERESHAGHAAGTMAGSGVGVEAVRVVPGMGSSGKAMVRNPRCCGRLRTAIHCTTSVEVFRRLANR